MAEIIQMPINGQREHFTHPGLFSLNARSNKEPIASSSEAQDESSTRPGNTIHEIQQGAESQTDDGAQSRLSARSQDIQQSKWLSCSFVKHNRSRYTQVYNSCTHRPGFRDPGKLVEHFKRVHSSRQGCLKCKIRFSGTERAARKALLGHLEKGQCTPRDLTDLEPEWMDAYQERLLTSSVIRSRESAEDKWRSIYCFLFRIPMEERSMTPTPWYDYLIPSHYQDELEAALLSFKATDKPGPVPDPTPSAIVGLCGTQFDGPELALSQQHLLNATNLPTSSDNTRRSDPADMAGQEWVVPKLIDSGYESALHDKGEFTVKNGACDDLCRSDRPTEQLETSNVVEEFDYNPRRDAQQYSADNFLIEAFLIEDFLAEASASTLTDMGQWADTDV